MQVSSTLSSATRHPEETLQSTTRQGREEEAKERHHLLILKRALMFGYSSHLALTVAIC